MMELSKTYNPAQAEERIYRFWLEKGYFTPKVEPGKKPFVIIMPPPNVTGELHLGHALTATIEDILIRYHRMKGEVTLWLPGSDHAGIATQVMVERELSKKGLSRHQIGREEFLKLTWEWAQNYKDIICRQHQKLGASCDWSRERFTLDQVHSQAVISTFVRLYKEGLLYRGEKIINYCPRCTTALSDLEVEHREIAGNLYYIRYPLTDGDFIPVATTRPETILGDTAIAVHPQDERFKGFIGRKALVPAIGREIPIIQDEAVDPKFGSGAVKVTPAHDPLDFEIGLRHNLPGVNIFNPDGTTNKNAGPFSNLDRFVCRKKLLEYLEQNGLVLKIEPHLHSVGHCQRCGAVLEPWLSEQWFVRMKPLAQPAIEAVRSGKIKIIPEHFAKTYIHWLENIQDWCISRQLWWGHRIPVWYCRKCPHLTVTTETPSSCFGCGSAEIYQDPDVLDTWFSSALWPHSALGWAVGSQDFAYFYPTTVMETGYDILFFWVARMVMMGIFNTGEIPFRYVLLHGLIRDEHGEKMSKTKGNVLDPVKLIEQYGCDGLRFALSTGTTPGNDLHIGITKIEAGRNFANKLWNAGRFILSALSSRPDLLSSSGDASVIDRWIMSRLSRVILRTRELMEQFELGEAERLISQFFWDEFCDWYLELAKLRLRWGENPLPVMVYVFEHCLKLLHPFMPFITEELYGHLKPYLRQPSEALIIAPYPEAEEKAIDPEAEKEMEAVIEVISGLRRLRAEVKAEPGRELEAFLFSPQPQKFKRHIKEIEALSRCRPLHIKEGEHPQGLTEVLKDAVLVLPVPPQDEGERKRKLKEELVRVQELIAQKEAWLKDEGFLCRAPAQVVEREREKLNQLKSRQKLLEQEINLGCD